jgi:hypothetical protein
LISYLKNGGKIIPDSGRKKEGRTFYARVFPDRRSFFAFFIACPITKGLLGGFLLSLKPPGLGPGFLFYCGTKALTYTPNKADGGPIHLLPWGEKEGMRVALTA